MTLALLFYMLTGIGQPRITVTQSMPSTMVYWTYDDAKAYVVVPPCGCSLALAPEMKRIF